MEKEKYERKQAEARIFAMELRRKELATQVKNKVRSVDTYRINVEFRAIFPVAFCRTPPAAVSVIASDM